ncbi:hypothetical protein HD593_001047 [Nonomuraea rubra]|uniref:Uncharacterized protein n=1 Tax=Nonomuraea rubra TaxID=46180 RepID=A0A7X0NMM9_9ACTN|nr:hypothetical protein [Nonomuraea rubra]
MANTIYRVIRKSRYIVVSVKLLANKVPGVSQENLTFASIR